MSEQGTTKAKLSCHIHPRYKAIRKPRPGCVLCHAMWQDKLVEEEQKQKRSVVIVGSVHGVRAMAPIPYKARRRCTCGCQSRATHYGLGDGVALMHGCELAVRRWMRDGVKARQVGDRP